jgi:nitric oxide synthase oxygenase domain/subunit
VCRPNPQLGKYGHSLETPHQTLVREALEYQEIYHKDKGSAPGLKEARVQQILAEIKATGSYIHTADELEHGARVAWRCVAATKRLKGFAFSDGLPACW